MKNFLKLISIFTILFIIICTNTNSQSFTFVSRDSIIRGGLTDLFEADSTVVKNKATAPRNLMVKMHFLKFVVGDSVSFCWDVCYPVQGGTDFTCSLPLFLTAKQTTGSKFSAHLNPVNSYGVTIVEFTFFNAEDPTDYISDTLTFDVQDPNIVLDPSTVVPFNLFPNPATDWIELSSSDISDIGKISIYNSVGIIVKSVETVTNRIDVGDLPQGTYFVRFSKNGSVIKSTNFIIYR